MKFSRKHWIALALAVVGVAVAMGLRDTFGTGEASPAATHAAAKREAFFAGMRAGAKRGGVGVAPADVRAVVLKANPMMGEDTPQAAELWREFERGYAAGVEEHARNSGKPDPRK